MRITELEYHGEVTWLNPGLTKKWKKGQGPAAHIFSKCNNRGHLAALSSSGTLSLSLQVRADHHMYTGKAEEERQQNHPGRQTRGREHQVQGNPAHSEVQSQQPARLGW